MPAGRCIGIFALFLMAYTGTNHQKTVEMIVRLYLSVKEYDIADSYIVRNLLPKHGIYISYRTWMNYKKSMRQPASPKTLPLQGTLL